MSKKHVDEYFNKICDDYHEMIEALHDLEQECENDLVDIDRIDQMKALIEPIKTNYMRISYIMYLLNQPNRKEKKKKYCSQNEKLLKQLDGNTISDVQYEDAQIINQMKIKD